MSYRNTIGWALHHLTPGPTVCTSTSGQDVLARGSRLLALSPTRSPWRVMPRHKWNHNFFLSRRVGRYGPHGLDVSPLGVGGCPPSRSSSRWRRGRAQGPQGEENISLKTQSMRQEFSAWSAFLALRASSRPSCGRTRGSGEEFAGQEEKRESRSRGNPPGGQQHVIASSSSPTHAKVSPADTLTQEGPCPLGYSL